MTAPSVTSREAWQLNMTVDAYDGKKHPLPAGWIIHPDWPGGKLDGLVTLGALREADGVVAIAIQGTENVDDVLKDFDLAWTPFDDVIPGSNISQGSMNGLNDLLKMPGTFSDVLLPQFLSSLAPGTGLLITGHSLGANLTSVFAPWIAVNVPAFAEWDNLLAVTFAVPTAGDTGLADYLDSQPNYQAHFNLYDMVPYTWSMHPSDAPFVASAIKDLFPSIHPAPEWLQATIAYAEKSLSHGDTFYKQTKATVFKGNPGNSSTWVGELWYQHVNAYNQEYG